MIRFNDPHATKLISQHCKVPFVPTHHQSIARYDRNDKLMGGVLFTDYNVVSAQIHVASFQPNWINKELLWVTFDYPFNQVGINKLIGLVPSTNVEALRFDMALGFVIETRVKDVFPDGDMLVLAMYKADCRFLKMKRPTLTLGSNHGPERSDP